MKIFTRIVWIVVIGCVIIGGVGVILAFGNPSGDMTNPQVLSSIIANGALATLPYVLVRAIQEGIRAFKSG